MADEGASKAKGKKAASKETSPPMLFCRNKQWNFPASFCGNWLLIPTKTLQTICNMNYNAPAPQPVDPAVMFDTLRIRRLIDDAKMLAVKAAGNDSPFARNPMDGGGGAGGGPGASAGILKLSRERKLRMREQICQKLSEAYRIDETATSAAIIRSSALEDVAAQVLKRKPKSAAARYVHFFHEKVPWLEMAEHTTLEALTELLEEDGHTAEILRTRATARVFKNDGYGAVRDLTDAMRQRRHEAQCQPETGTKGEIRRQRRAVDAPVPEEAYPDSLPGQLLFNRASVYLAMACRNASTGFSSAPTPLPRTRHRCGKSNVAPPSPPPEPTENEETIKRRADAQKEAKRLAKCALRDYMAFLGRFQYSPDWPVEVSWEFILCIRATNSGRRKPRDLQHLESAAAPTNRLYPVSKLFAAVPVADIPPYPAQDPGTKESPSISLPANGNAPARQPAGVCETVTYHPLLIEALHAMLLCHCLVQTSTKEIQRHAYMVARLVRLCDGFPVFMPPYAPSREDWTLLTQLPQTDTGLLPLSASWDDLCTPESASLLNQRGTDAERLVDAANATSSSGSSSKSVNRAKGAVAATHSSLAAFVQTCSSKAPSQSDEAILDAMIRPGGRFGEWKTENDMATDEYGRKRSEAIALWLREAPVVPSMARRNKAGKQAKQATTAELPVRSGL